MQDMFTKSKWFKGNLHTHTTLSDGIKTPAEAIQLYRENGYDFLSITDHMIYSPNSNSENMLLLSGIECTSGDYRENKSCHITGVGMTEHVKIPEGTMPNEIISILKKANGFATVAHPYWFHITTDDLLNFRGYDAIEVYNDVAQVCADKGYSDTLIEPLVDAGRFPLLTAVDDTHFYDKDGLYGYIMVNADALDHETIMQAIFSGSFYASTGFEFKQIIIDDSKVIVTFDDPAAKVIFYGNCVYANPVVLDGEMKTATYTLQKDDKTIRIYAENENGDKAYSQIIKL
ncbi:MAG: hypothetical protein KAQ68_07785 [Clostridiales bacterium]|nr:hypothetical protein [Clostridiales bacterium]